MDRDIHNESVLSTNRSVINRFITGNKNLEQSPNVSIDVRRSLNNDNNYNTNNNIRIIPKPFGNKKSLNL